MPPPSLNQPAAATASASGIGDYIELMKPRVMWLAIFTALVGMIAAPGPVSPVTASAALLFIAMGAGAAGVLNMWLEVDIDAKMARTRNRPLPAGRLAPTDALAFGTLLAAASVLAMGVAINWIAAGLLAASIAFYLVIYTAWLKQRTPLNIVIGGAAGAFPPVIGWAAAANAVDLAPFTLFLIIFIWTPPHFWALACLRQKEYAAAGLPMLPVTAGMEETKRQILLYAILLLPAAFLPWIAGIAGILNTVLAGVLSIAFIAAAAALRRADSHADTAIAARKLFRFSILYLFLLFAALLAEHAVMDALAIIRGTPAP